MKKLTFKWRYLTLLVMLFSVMSASYADTNKTSSTSTPPGERLAITPAALDLGMWPVGGWQEPAVLTLVNAGVGSLEITASEIEDDGRLALTALDLPLVLAEGDDVEVGVSFIGSSVGSITATYVASWGADRSVTTADVTVTSYVPAEDDIVETASVFTVPSSANPLQFSSPSSREYDGLYKNYILPQDVAAGDHDFVYEIVASTDVFFNVLISSGTNTNMALYAADFGGEEGPMADNALVQGFTSIVDFPMFSGSYYLVVSAEGASVGNISGTPMTAPAMVVNQLPVDGEVDVVNGDDLTWTYGGTDALEYQVVLGTTYPPTDVVMDWTAASEMGDTYELVGLEANLQYFWRVNVRNNVGNTDGDIWGFTTTITPALDVVAVSEELFMGDDVVLNWASPIGGDRALLGYNVYRDGVMLNTDLLVDLTYTDETELAYDMTGYTYNVTSVFDEGESAYSNDVVVTVSGEGSIDGTVIDDVTDLAIEGAAVAIEGVDEYGNDVTYSATTSASGTYVVDVKVGTYDITVSADGYIDGMATDIDVAYDVATTQDFELAEVAYALASVVATELDDDEVHLEWTFEESTRELVDFDIYRGLWDQVDIDNFTLVGSTTQNQFIDYDWGVQTSGVYRWAVVAVYTESESLPTFSEPLLDKDMETMVNVAVSLNTAESPAGTEVTLTNTSEVYLELEYTTTLDETGLFTFEDFRKGTYEVEVSLFGYESQYQMVTITEETDLDYLLVEILNPVSDLYVNPNGYATWGVPVAGGLDMYTADFEGGIPSDIEVLSMGSSDDGKWVSTIYGYIGDGVFSAWSPIGGTTDTRMNTPKVTLTENTVIQFAFVKYQWAPTDLTIEISFNEGLTWTSIWSINDGTYDILTWYEATVDVAALGYTEGDAMFSIHKTDDWGGRSWFDELYIGDAEVPAGSVAISSTGVLADDIDKNNITAVQAMNAMANVEMLPNNLLASSNADRSLTTFKVSLDDVFSGNTTDTFYDYEVEETLVEGTTYTAKVEADYTTGLSEAMYYTFVYHTCAYYNAVADVTATRIEGTMNMELAWTNDVSDVDADVFVGTNVYRDGEMIAFVAVGTEMYIDESLTSGDYTYVLTQLYESDAESCEVSVDATMTAGGFVNGFVREFAGDNAPIEGAVVTLIGEVSAFEFTTDATGYYEGEVVEGTFDYEVAAASYATENLEDVVIDFGATVVKDFLLKEYPYSVGTVVATELNDNTVQVDWSGTGGGGGTEGVDFDFEDNIMPAGMMLDTPDANWTVADGMMKITTSGAGVWRSSYYDQEFDNFVYEVEMQRNSGSEGGSMGIILRSNGFSTVTAGDGSNGLIFCVTANGYYFTGTLTDGDMPDWSDWLTSSAINTGLGTSNVVSAEATGSLIKLFINGTLVTTMTTTLESGYCGVFAHEGDVASEVAWDSFKVVPNARAMDFDVAENIGLEGKGSLTECVTSYESNGKFAKGVNILPAQPSTRELTGYNVYRGACGAMDEDMVFMGYTLDMQFTDNTWGAAEPGVYSWAVESVYDFNESEFVYSNCLDKDMVTTVSVTVTTNSSDSPEETDVMFTNTSEPELELVYETELDDTGMYTWDEFRKGTYDIYVHKNGFADIMLEGVSIWEASDFTWVLEELLLPVSDLYVTPLGYATWGSGGEVPFEPVFENFDEGLPETWMIVVGGASDDSWFWTTDDAGSSLDGTAFMFVDSDAAGSVDMDELLVSPIIENTENADMLFVEFDHYLNNFLDADLGEVQVFDGDEWVVVASYVTDIGSWDTPDHVSIDVTEYANEDFQVRFHYVANYGWYWAVDNFAVTDGSDRYADRELEYFKVFHDYNFITDTDTTFYQYGDNGEVLVPGETYMAEVAAVYSTGMSAKMFYEWTYYPCDSFAGPAQFMANNVEATKDVLLQWSDILPMSLVSITQNPGAPSNGYYQSYDFGYGVVYDLSAYPDALASTIEFHHAAWGTAGPHDYNIHIINWDTEEVLAELGPFTTTGDDQWEMDVNLGDVDLMGAANVAFLMEPLSNSAADAYPDLSSDDAADPQGSVYGSLADISAIGSSTIGNFLMNISIMTANGPVRVSSTQLDIPAAPKATPRVGLGNAVTEAVITNQMATREVEDVFMGANLYRDGEMIAEMVMDTFYLDEALVPAYYDYCIKYVYESGAMSCGTCVNDVMVPEDCDAPQNLTATLNEETYADIFLAWNQAEQVEYRYDDGVATGQLGIGSGGTTNDVLGNVHRVNTELSEMSWFLTDNGGPHANIDIWVFGLDAAGIPDHNNVLFTATVSNTDLEWNTFTFNEPLVIDGGFFLGVSYAGFVALGMDDGVGAPYEFINNTQYAVVDYTTGGWMTLESIDFPQNFTIRATGMESSVASYEVESIESDGTSAFTYVRSPEATVTGTPNWTNPIVSANREFTGYNIYRDGSLLVEGYQETTYTDSEGLSNGTVYCYEVTAMYSVCGESAPSNEACAGYVGIPGIDASEVAIYPNPATSLVNITSSQEMTSISVINYVGQVVYQSDLNNETAVQLNTSSFENGVYVIRLDSENGVVTKRVIIAQ